MFPRKDYTLPVRTLFGDEAYEGKLKEIIDALDRANIDHTTLDEEYEATRILPSGIKSVMQHFMYTKNLLREKYNETKNSSRLEEKLCAVLIERAEQDIDLHVDILQQDFNVDLSGESIL